MEFAAWAARPTPESYQVAHDALVRVLTTGDPGLADFKMAAELHLFKQEYEEAAVALRRGCILAGDAESRLLQQCYVMLGTVTRRIGALSESLEAWTRAMSVCKASTSGYARPDLMVQYAWTVEKEEEAAETPRRRSPLLFTEVFRALVGEEEEGLIDVPALACVWRRTPSMWLDRGEFHRARGDFLLAADCVTEGMRLLCESVGVSPPRLLALPADPGYAEACVEIYLRAGEEERATQASHTALKCLPNVPLFQSKLARVYRLNLPHVDAAVLVRARRILDPVVSSVMRRVRQRITWRHKQHRMHARWQARLPVFQLPPHIGPVPFILPFHRALCAVEPYLTPLDKCRVCATCHTVRSPGVWEHVWRSITLRPCAPGGVPSSPSSSSSSSSCPHWRILGPTVEVSVWWSWLTSLSVSACGALTPSRLRSVLLACPSLSFLDVSLNPQLAHALPGVFTPGRSPSTVDIAEEQLSCTHAYDSNGVEVIMTLAPAADEGLHGSNSEGTHSESGSDGYDTSDSGSESPSVDDPPLAAPVVEAVYATPLSCARCKYTLPPQPPLPRAKPALTMLERSRNWFPVAKRMQVDPEPPPPLAPPPAPLPPPPWRAPTLFPCLRSLSLRWCDVVDDDITAVAIACPALTSLSVFRCGRVTDAGITALARYCRQLACLDATTCANVTDVGIAMLASHCPCLAVLRLNDTARVVVLPPVAPKGKEGMSSPPAGRPPLQSLSALAGVATRDATGRRRRLNLPRLGALIGISDACVMAFANAKPHWSLRTLELKGASVTDLGVEILVALAGPSLLRIDLSHCPAVGDASLRHIAASCPRLRLLTLKLGKGSGVTDAGLVHFMKHKPPFCEFVCVTVAKASLHASARVPAADAFLTALALRTVAHTDAVGVLALPAPEPEVLPLSPQRRMQ